MKSIFVLILLVASSTCFSQSFFKPVPKPVLKTHLKLNRLTIAQPDSTFNGFRPIVSAAVYGYTKASGSSLFTGAGLSYEHDTFDYSTQKWYTNYSVGGLFYAGGSAAPSGLSSVIAAGVALSFFNKLASVGAAYNFQVKQWMPTLGVSISLNN